MAYGEGDSFVVAELQQTPFRGAGRARDIRFNFLNPTGRRCTLNRLFRDHPARWRGRRGCRRRNRERDPGVPAVGTVLRCKFAIILQIEIALQVADRKDEAVLRANPDHLRVKAADAVAGAAVAADLLVDIAHRSRRPRTSGARPRASIAKFRTRRPAHICEASRYRAVFERPSYLTRLRRTDWLGRRDSKLCISKSDLLNFIPPQRV